MYESVVYEKKGLVCSNDVPMPKILSQGDVIVKVCARR
jgi:threonine dehydrogenase-like Zn-dependent dehydrogenase